MKPIAYKKHRLFLICPLLSLAIGSVYAAETALISQSSAGIQGNSHSSADSAMSADGRYVVFKSTASNLVAGDTNSSSDIFVYDRQTGQTRRASISSTGVEANNDSQLPTISADGRFVAFNSFASNLIAGDSNAKIDTFVHDLQTGITTRVNVSSTGVEANGSSNYLPALSANGRFVAFNSDASNLVASDTNGSRDVFVRDRQTNKTTRVSISTAGAQANNHSVFAPAISADGRYVAFTSDATNFSADQNAGSNTFVRDRTLNKTELVSPRIAVTGGGASWLAPSISADGRYVVFNSGADNLVAGDLNLKQDTFLRDRTTAVTRLVSTSTAGVQGNGTSSSFARPIISASGRFVVFGSEASNLVANDSNAKNDVFMRDMQTLTTSRISVDTAGAQAIGASDYPAVSADGRFISFSSDASNLLAAGDGNLKSDIFIRDRLLTTAKTADLQVVASLEPATVQKSIDATYRYTITNNGADSAASVSWVDVLSNASVTSLTASQGTCKKAGVSVCSLGTLAAGSSATITVVVKATLSPFVQTLNVSAAPIDAVRENNSLIISTPVTP
ncbi:hypothetical protein JCM14076_08700 [Methylosoma difficile]